MGEERERKGKAGDAFPGSEAVCTVTTWGREYRTSWSRAGGLSRTADVGGHTKGMRREEAEE